MNLLTYIRERLFPHPPELNKVESVFREERAKLKTALKERGLHGAFKDMEERLKPLVDGDASGPPKERE